MVRKLLSALLVAMPAVALADPPAGQVDPTFGDFDGGIVGLQIEGFNIGGDYTDRFLGMTEDSVGRLVVGGFAETDDGVCLGLMRFTPDGRLDNVAFGFNQNNVAKGKICHPFPDAPTFPGRGFNLLALPEGGFLVSGTVGVSTPFVCRFDDAGRKVGAFGDDDGCMTFLQISSGALFSVPILLADGDSVLLVTNHVQDTLVSPVLVRFSLQTGAIVPYGQDDVVELLPANLLGVANAALLTVDGDLITAGLIIDQNNGADAFVSRFDLQTLKRDATFSGDGIVRPKLNQDGGDELFSALDHSPGGHILAAGSARSPGRESLAVIQIDAATGEFDESFNDGLPLIHDSCADFPSGCSSLRVGAIERTATHVVVAANGGGGIIASRFLPDGSIDGGFAQHGTMHIGMGTNSNTERTGMVMQGDRVVLAATTWLNGDSEDFAILRLSDGRLFEDEFEEATP